ncbi:MAG TPA: hypothetical protein PKE04_03355 [Clostridia bacterium]|nr:hypothetical protein [Clostridia bacterium]
MSDAVLFEDRESFRNWLEANVDQPGIWVLFGKKGGPKTLSAAHALEEALCFGWIDGQMESLDDKRYRKYFAPRRVQSNWSEKNRALAAKLEDEGKMTEHGRKKIEIAKKNGGWEAQKRFVPSAEQVEALKERLRPYEPAYANFIHMIPSVQRTYTGFCMDVKSEEAGAKRFAQLVERLNLNLNPMESLKKAK